MTLDMTTYVFALMTRRDCASMFACLIPVGVPPPASALDPSPNAITAVAACLCSDTKVKLIGMQWTRQFANGGKEGWCMTMARLNLRA